MSWWVRIRRWVERKKSKLPAWVLFALVVFKEVYTGVPDLFDATKFWLETVKAMDGTVGWIAVIVDSPWFSVVLILVGIVWLRFVGESRYVVRHPALSLLGWMFVGVIALAFWSVLVAGYVATRVTQQVAGEAKAQIKSLTQTNQQLQKDFEVVKKDSEVVKRELQRQTSPWELTENQKRQLVAALKRYKVPLGTTYQVKISTPDMCEKCAGYAIDLVEAWYEIPGWEIGKDVIYALDVRLQGVEIPVDMEGCSPEGLFLVMKVLEAAEIKYKKVLTEGKVRLGLCSIFVGNRPQE